MPALATSGLALLPPGSLARTPGGGGRLPAAIGRFAALPSASCLFQVTTL